jgi:hypothetical protein
VQLSEPLAPREVLVTDAIPCSLSVIQRSSLCLPVTVKGGGLHNMSTVLLRMFGDFHQLCSSPICITIVFGKGVITKSSKKMISDHRFRKAHTRASHRQRVLSHQHEADPRIRG